MSAQIPLDPFQWNMAEQKDEEEAVQAIPPWTACQSLKSRLMDIVLTEREEFYHRRQNAHQSIPEDLEPPQSPPGGNSLKGPESKELESKSTAQASDSCRIEADLKILNKLLSDLFQILNACFHDGRKNHDMPITSLDHGGDDQSRSRRKQRDTDFQSRLKRSLYDLSQKVSQTKVAILKLNLCGETKRKNNENFAAKKLHLTLRQLVSVLKILLSQAPFSSPRFFERNYWTEISTHISKVFKLCSDLGYPHPELASNLQKMRLVTVRAVHENSFSLSRKTGLSDPARNVTTTLPRIDLINNLAKEKFGARSPTKQYAKKTKSMSLLETPRSMMAGTSGKSSEEPSPKMPEKALLLELSDYDLGAILQARRNGSSIDFLIFDPRTLQNCARQSWTYLRNSSSENVEIQDDPSSPVNIVRDISHEIVSHLVDQVCEEMTQNLGGLVSGLIFEELSITK